MAAKAVRVVSRVAVASTKTKVQVKIELRAEMKVVEARRLIMTIASGIHWPGVKNSTFSLRA